MCPSLVMDMFVIVVLLGVHSALQDGVITVQLEDICLGNRNQETTQEAQITEAAGWL